MDKVHGIQTELPFPKPEKKKCVEYLYIGADEDHIHKQDKKGTEKKSSMIGKLLYLYEGQEKKDGRKELKNVFYLGGLCSAGFDVYNSRKNSQSPFHKRTLATIVSSYKNSAVFNNA